jgi:hypothetical protein
MRLSPAAAVSYDLVCCVCFVQVALRDFPHGRPLCGTKPFKKGVEASNSSTCTNVRACTAPHCSTDACQLRQVTACCVNMLCVVLACCVGYAVAALAMSWFMHVTVAVDWQLTAAAGLSSMLECETF